MVPVVEQFPVNSEDWMEFSRVGGPPNSTKTGTGVSGGRKKSDNVAWKQLGAALKRASNYHI